MSEEHALIEKIRLWSGKFSARTLCGIGDDAAVTLPPKEKMLATMDMLVEGIHFDFAYVTAYELGHKALAANLSDIAAMGGEPLFALVTLGLKRVEEKAVEELYTGMRTLAEKYAVDIVGGNLVRSPERSLVDIVVIGQSTGRVVTRAGAREGDLVAVTGIPGASAAGLWALQKQGRAACVEFPCVTRAHLLPEPRLTAGKLLTNHGATSLIDVSDGVSSEITYLAHASGHRFVLEKEAFPKNDEMEEIAFRSGTATWDFTLDGGEDYELLVTLPKNSVSDASAALAAVGLTLTVVGRVEGKGSGVFIEEDSKKRFPLAMKGFDHFREPASNGS